MIEISKSPLSTTKLEPFLECKDYTVSKKTFQILIDKESELLITSPRPKIENLGLYYESENYISHTDAKQSFFDKIYHIVKKYAIAKKVNLVKSFTTFNTNQKSLLDIGCGTGDFLVACKKNNFTVFGVEPNQKAITLTKNKLEGLAETKTNLQNSNVFSSIEKLPTNQQFDIITMWHVLEHVPDIENYSAVLKKLLKPKGTLIVAVPNYKSFDAKYYGKFWAAYDLPRHLWHFSKKSIAILFQKENIKLVKTLPMKFDSYYVSLLSEKYKTGKSNLIKAFYIGFMSNLKAITSKEHSSIIYVLKNQ